MAICLIFLGFLFGTNCTETKPMVYSVNETISNQLTSNVSNELQNNPNIPGDLCSHSNFQPIRGL